MNNIKTIFLTGATGFIGSYLTYELLKQGHNLKLLVRNSKDGAEERLKKSLYYLFDEPDEYLKHKKQIEVVAGDITRKNLSIEKDSFKRLCSEVDLVIHNAALVKFEETKKGELEKCNVKGTENMLEFALRLSSSPARFYYVSTAYVCGKSGGTFLEEDLDIGQSFNNLYEESKFKAEMLLKEYRTKFDIKTTVYRPTIVVGDSRRGRTSNFLGIYSLIKAVYFLYDVFSSDLEKGGKRAGLAGVSYKKGKLNIPLRIPVNLNKKLNIVPVDYVVDCIMGSLDKPASSNKVYNIGNPKPVSLQWLNKTFCSLLKISGIVLVDHNGFDSRCLTEWEKLFLMSIKEVGPYLTTNEPMFSHNNVREILKGTDIRCPEITGKFLGVIFRYYINSIRFKK